jgi:hypothetical protein
MRTEGNEPVSFDLSVAWWVISHFFFWAGRNAMESGPGSTQLSFYTAKIYCVARISTDMTTLWFRFQLSGSESGCRISTKHTLRPDLGFSP